VLPFFFLGDYAIGEVVPVRNIPQLANEGLVRNHSFHLCIASVKQAIVDEDKLVYISSDSELWIVGLPADPEKSH
jgi:hypothetical protein